MNERPGIFCITSYEKGQPFLREAHRLGADVYLLTMDRLRDGDWPRESLTELHTMPEGLSAEQLRNTVSYLARTRRIDRIVALDEFDQENAAMLREHLRLPGMGVTAASYFRDKLAMRMRAQEAGVPVPEFTGVFHYDDVRAFMSAVPGPWLLKPRANASAIGIKKIEQADELWPVLEQLGDKQSEYLLERFVPGEVFHVDAVTWKGKVVFSAPHQYGQPPMRTMHEGGVFTTRRLHPESDDARALLELHERVIAALGMVAGVTHTEFIRSSANGAFRFLECAARVGGAHIADVVEAASGINLWAEWARIEIAQAQAEYRLPQVRHSYAGSVICLARQEWPDTSAYDDPEIIQRLSRRHHAGVIVQADEPERVQELVESYGLRFWEEFGASAPVPTDRPTA
ncbi:MAG TPA: ATP-grasp domain-containing protein [Granulicella sp.]